MSDLSELQRHEIKLHLVDYISEKDIVEELRLLADSMSSHKALADKIGVSETYLSDVLHGKRSPGLPIQRFLKVKRVSVYVEAK